VLWSAFRFNKRSGDSRSWLINIKVCLLRLIDLTNGLVLVTPDNEIEPIWKLFRMNRLFKRCPDFGSFEPILVNHKDIIVFLMIFRNIESYSPVFDLFIELFVLNIAQSIQS